jgi:hypothetical protein
MLTRAALLATRSASLLAVAGATATDMYCDGNGGLTQTWRGNSDPTCHDSRMGPSGNDGCSAAQVGAAMRAAP